MDSTELKLILASGSPRRKELLQQAGYQFTVDIPDDSAEEAAEQNAEKLLPIELVGALAFAKAHNVAKRTAQGLILAADTVAHCAGNVLGKPTDREHAKRMLTTMRGTVHHVHTGVCLWSRPDDRKLLKTETTELEMANLSDEKIEQYLDSGLWEGKAGAFGYQDDIDWVTIRNGSSSNVVGLPMQLLAQMLNVFRQN